jgi:DNA-binding IclR family transcriptional regulator
MLGKLNQVLSLFSRERRELSVMEVAKRLRRPRSTVYRVLAQIEQEGFLDRDVHTGLYRLGIKLATLGELARHSTSLQRIAFPELTALSEQSGETATLLLLVDGEGLAMQHVESHHRVAAKGVLGREWPLHASAGGKALLAWLPEDEQRALVKRSLKRYTESTITTIASLRRELQLTRQRGFATVRGEYMEDLWGVAGPVFNHREGLEAAITLGGPHSRVTQERFRALGRLVVMACERVSRKAGYTGPYPRRAIVSEDGGPVEAGRTTA